MIEDERADQFIQLLAQHERRLAAYVMTFVSSPTDADDILQETKIWLWRSFDQFEIGTSFGAWARKAAFFRIQDYFKKRSAERKRLVFSDECLVQLAESFEATLDFREDRTERLAECVSKLTPMHRKILALRYREELPVDELASQINRTVTATYRVLSRIRLALRECMSKPNNDSVADAGVLQ